MADDHGGGGGDSSKGFLTLFFGVIILIWFLSAGGNKPLIGSGTSTTTGNGGGGATYLEAGEDMNTYSTIPPSQSRKELEGEIARTREAIDRLKEERDEARLWNPPSPYREKVYLSSGSAGSRDVDTEYLTLYAHSGNTEDITITGWRIESMVSDAWENIPQGNNKPRRRSDTTEYPIILEPGDTAYVITGESPIGMSFRENICTGYFEQFQDFTPSLSHQCPNPIEEMEWFAKIALDNDACYDFVERIPSCSISREDMEDEDLSQRCEIFVDEILTYSGCFKNHEHDPFFTLPTWHVYLDEGEHLWRSEREIIRLLDNEKRVVDVIRY